MAVKGYHSPFMASVTATTTAQSLLTLMQAVYSDIPGKACYVTVQLDTAAGSASLYIGNSNVTSSVCGVNLSANQNKEVFAFDSNLITLNDLWLLSSSGSIQANVTVMVR